MKCCYGLFGRKSFLISICLLALVLANSCLSRPDLRFEAERPTYVQAKDCMIRNYETMFPPESNAGAVSFYFGEKINYPQCDSQLRALQNFGIAVAELRRDSTVIFYSATDGGISSKQALVMYLGQPSKLKEEALQGIKIIAMRGEGWFEGKRIVSLAN